MKKAAQGIMFNKLGKINFKRRLDLGLVKIAYFIKVEYATKTILSF